MRRLNDNGEDIYKRKYTVMDSSSRLDIGFSGFTGPTGYSGVTGYSDDFENYRKKLIEAMEIILGSEPIEIRRENYNMVIQEKGRIERTERACGGID